MRSMRHFYLILAIFIFVITLPSAVAQVVVATLPTGNTPDAAAVNTQTNKIYVTNHCGGDPTCESPGTVSVIDGVTNQVATVTVGAVPIAAAVNSATNKIYVANYCGTVPNCGLGTQGTVTVIDGATNTTFSVNVGLSPLAIAVNPVTNKIYVANQCGDANCHSNSTLTVIDGATNNTATVNAGVIPWSVAVNSVTNKIYVVNHCQDCQSGGTVTVIDGATNSTQAVSVGAYPGYVAVNSVTNKIYVSNLCGSDITCHSAGTVTVIDGATNATSVVNAGIVPRTLAVNSATNKIYVENSCGTDLNCGTVGTVTVIDGATNSTQTINVGFTPWAIAADSVTNKIYVVNIYGNDATEQSVGSVSVIDGIANAVVPVAVGDAPFSLALNEVTDRVYVPDSGDNAVSVIAGDTALQFVPVTPCRVVDTRGVNGTFGGPAIQGRTSRSFPIPQGSCDIPATAAAYSLNVTLVPDQGTPVGYLTIWPAGEVSLPIVSTMNSLDGRNKANAAVVPAGVNGGVSVYVTNTTDVVLDINGYFTLPGENTLQFYPLTPCRVLDTRKQTGDLGGPSLAGGQERDFPLLESSCIPEGANAAAYSLNLTVVPVAGSLGYLTVWPAGQSKPLVSTLNNPTGTIVANAAIVPAGSGGSIAVFASNDTQLVGDINGYFAPAGTGGVSLYPGAPCRVLDTRKIGSGQGFTGVLSPPVDVAGSVCGIPTTAQGYIFNATVVPDGALGYLSLWPDGADQPLVSTLNAMDGAITSNMAIVPNGDGKTDAFASGYTQLILDISGYFAP